MGSIKNESKSTVYSTCGSCYVFENFIRKSVKFNNQELLNEDPLRMIQ